MSFFKPWEQRNKGKGWNRTPQQQQPLWDEPEAEKPIKKVVAPKPAPANRKKTKSAGAIVNGVRIIDID